MAEDPTQIQDAKDTRYRNTIGSIVTWGIIRAAIVMLLSWFVGDMVGWLDYGTWWMLTVLIFYAAVLHPMQVQYRLYKEETAQVMDGTLCSTCRYFEPTGVLCSKLDEHVSEHDIPCEGELWEPTSSM